MSLLFAIHLLLSLPPGVSLDEGSSTSTNLPMEEWRVDFGLGAKGLEPPWLVAGIEQHVSEHLFVRGAAEVGFLAWRGPFHIDDRQLSGVVVAGPRFVFNPADALVGSIYLVGGIGVRGDLADAASFSLGTLNFHGAARLGGAIELAVTEHVGLRASSDLVAGTARWKLGPPGAPPEEIVRDPEYLGGLTLAPTVAVVIDL